jgi:PKD repeat protein
MFRASLFQIVMLCVFGLTAIAAPPDQAKGPPDRYIVQVTEGSVPGQIGRGVAQHTGGKLVHVYTSAVKGFSIHVPPGLTKKDIESQPGVLLVEPDVQVYAVGQSQTLPTGVDRIEADPVGAPVSVDVDIAIIDTGIDVDHPDLHVVGGRHFYSLLGLISFEDDAYDDDNGHGSHCAGIAAARNNDIGVVGIAPGARLWAVKVLDASGSGYLSDVIAGIDWVTARHDTIEVANMSLAATANSSAFRTAVQNSVAAGIFYAVAAGNDGKDVYGYDGVLGTSDDVIPAAYPEAATISAMADSDGIPGGLGASTSYGPDDSFASFSNYSASVVSNNPVDSPGMAIDLLMPGVDIYSCSMNGVYATHSGTSMASPHAAGLAALYIASNGRATSAGGVYAIRQALINAGVAQADPDLGLAQEHQNDPDGNKENIGWAGSTQTEPPVSGPPLADFVGNPTVGNSPLEVFFTDRSTGTVTSWSWDFGDDKGTSTAKNPTYEYTSAGTYTVSLTVTNNDGNDTEIKNDYITVSAPAPVLPVADFSASTTNGDAPLTVNFIDLSSGDPASWSWDFDDDGIEDATTQNPSYTYSVPGVYTVTLTATNAYGFDEETKVEYINVTLPASDPLVADFGGSPIIGEAPLTVRFTDLSSGDLVSWAWNFGTDYISIQQNPVYTYSQPGNYTVMLTVVDFGLNVDLEIKSNYITVTGQTGNPPVAEFTYTATGLSVDFTDQSTDSDGSVVAWNWNFGDDTISTAQNPSHPYATSGTYTVTLTVTDDDGATDTVSKAVTVSAPTVNNPPTASFIADPTSGVAPLTVEFDASGSNDTDGSIVSYAWNFGDGAYDTGSTLSHTYTASGTYTVMLTVTDDDGDTGSTTHVVTVSEPTGGGTMYVDYLQVDKVGLGKGWSTVSAFIVVIDDTGLPIGGAQVTVEFTGAINETVISDTLTDGSGGVTIDSTLSARNPCKTTGCVINVTRSNYTWGDAEALCENSW